MMSRKISRAALISGGAPGRGLGGSAAYRDFQITPSVPSQNVLVAACSGFSHRSVRRVAGSASPRMSSFSGRRAFTAQMEGPKAVRSCPTRGEQLRREDAAPPLPRPEILCPSRALLYVRHAPRRGIRRPAETGLAPIARISNVPSFFHGNDAGAVAVMAGPGACRATLRRHRPRGLRANIWRCLGRKESGHILPQVSRSTARLPWRLVPRALRNLLSAVISVLSRRSASAR